MKNIKHMFFNILTYFISILAIEMIFRAAAGFDLYFMTIIRVILYTLAISTLLGYLTSLLNSKYAKWIRFTIILVIAIYAFVELEFKNFLDNYYSFSAVSDGAGRISEYVITFIRDAKWYYWCVFIIPLLDLIFDIIDKRNIKTSFKWYGLVSSFILSGLLIIVSYFSLGISNTAIDLKDVYARFNNNDLLIDKLGLDHFLARDIVALFIEPDNSLDIIITTDEPEVTPTETTDTIKIIDDTRLKEDMQNETDETIRTIDQYILAQSGQIEENEHTNEFKDYNFIYVLVESFDYMAIDEELTPTLYKMMNEGYWFKEHYTPKYSCTTGESEFIANASLVPYNDVCTPNEVPDNAYPEALANLFKNAGYDTYSFHNWYDQYYDRRVEHASFGFDAYYNYEDLDIKEIQGWQSDLALVEEAIPYFIDSDRFFSFIISSSMHWPYDESSTLGDKYLEEIDKAHGDYPIDVKRYLSKSMEFDKAMEYLIDTLEENGKLDDTIICLYSDHNPFKLLEDTIAAHSPLMDRTTTYGISKTPFIMYNPNLEATVFEEVNSTFDQVPTIANMFGLNYDPRLYIGKDIFLDESLVIFPNSDWITKDGIYLSASNTFIPLDKELSQAKIDKINTKVRNAFSVSYAIMDTDYFSKRSYLGDPSIK